MHGLIFVLTISIIAVVLLLKNENCFRNQMCILEAIYQYFQNNKPKDVAELVGMYNAIEPYEVTFLRLWDWGYTRIVDEETFELIKPYIKKGKKTNE